jgi:hypothetical protein
MRSLHAAEPPRDPKYMQRAVIKIANRQIAPQLLK